jgi:hypothetical protein
MQTREASAWLLATLLGAALLLALVPELADGLRALGLARAAPLDAAALAQLAQAGAAAPQGGALAPAQQGRPALRPDAGADRGALAPEVARDIDPEQAEKELEEAAAAEERAEEQAAGRAEEQAAEQADAQAEEEEEADGAADGVADGAADGAAARRPGTGSTCVSASSRVDPLVATRLAERCGYYTSEAGRWRERASQPDATTVVSYAQRSGLGDRMSGLVASFHAAMGSGARMHVKWFGNNALAPSCLLDGIFSGVDSATSAARPASGECLQRACSAARADRLACHGAATNVSFHDDRWLIKACGPARVCNKLHEDAVARKQGGYGLVETAGCPLRMQFEVSDELHEFRVRWFADGKEHEGPLRQLASYLVQHRVIATHVRIGDWALTHGFEGTAGAQDKTLGCIQSVDATLSAAHDDDRPVRWLVAADTQGLRDWFLHKYPEKLVMLLADPVHISKRGTRDAYKTTMNTFAEWYAISLASELISGHVTHRASAFSASAWLWSLRDRYHKLVLGAKSSCTPAVFKYEGCFYKWGGSCDVDFDAYVKAQGVAVL